MNTKTETETKVTTNDIKGTVVRVRYPLFIMFAEYLGYVSPLIDWAEDMCNGKELPSYKKSILKADALSIFHRIENDCPLSDVRELYMDYYDIVLEEYDKNLCHMDNNTDDLPF